jgi:CRP-like cAMP-binding protein
MLAYENLKNLEIFSTSKKETIEKLCQCSSVSSYEKGDVLFGEHDKVSSNYIILTGKVIMSRYSEQGQKRTFYILGEGEIVNEVIFEDLPASVECEIYEKAQILAVNKTCLLSLMEGDFGLTMSVMNSLGKKVRRLYRQLKNTVPIKLDKRLAAKLWKLSRDYGIKEEQWTFIDVKISVTELSYMLGTSRESLSRSMKELKTQGMIKWEGKKLYTKSEDLLRYFKKP